MHAIQYDLCIIGGGINGVSIAHDAAGRGLRVCLLEKDDIAAHTSSHSSQLIHGGLRYLQYFQWGMVKASLKERAYLLQNAPHLVHPLKFVIPNNPVVRSPLLIRLGLFLYRHIAGRTALPTHVINDTALEPLKPQFEQLFTYDDCFVHDARLVISYACAAFEHGATILPQTVCLWAKPEKSHWQIFIYEQKTKIIRSITARALVNATGPWVTKVATQQLHNPHKHVLTLVQGSHIVVPKLYEGEHAYVLQQNDARIVFVLPFEKDYQLIGTTEKEFTGNLDDPKIQASEINYLCDLVNEYFKKSIAPEDIIWHYSGVRPLFKSAHKSMSALSRESFLEIVVNNKAPLINIFGGKITTSRLLAEQVLKKLKPYFKDLKPAWTATAKLPGSDFPEITFAEFLQNFHQKYAWLPTDLANRYAYSYGQRAHTFLANKHKLNDLGEHFGHGLYEAEVLYLIQHEWALHAEDILFRRTRLGIQFSISERERLAKYLNSQNQQQQQI